MASAPRHQQNKVPPDTLNVVNNVPIIVLGLSASSNYKNRKPPSDRIIEGRRELLRENDGNCCGNGNLERNAQVVAGNLLEARRNPVFVINRVVSPFFANQNEHKRKLNNRLRNNENIAGSEKNRERELLVSLMNENENEKRLVSPYFVKKGNKEIKKRKRKPDSDQSCGEILNVLVKREDGGDCYVWGGNEERNSLRGLSLDLQTKVDSPYIMAKHRENNQVLEENKKGRDLSQSMKNEDEKRNDSKEETKRKRKKKIQNDQFYGEIETREANITLPKVRKQRNSKKKTSENEVELETGKKVKKLRKGNKEGTLVDQCCMEKNNADKNSRLQLKTMVSAALITNMNKEAEQKNITVTLESAKVDEEEPLHHLKVDNCLDEPTLHDDQGGYDLMIGNISKIAKKKKKKKTASLKCDSAAGQENALDPLSLRSIHDNQNCSKALASKVISPYFRKVSKENEFDGERDEADCRNKKKRRVDKTMYVEFEELLSKYAYQGGSYLNREEEIGGKKEDGSAGKGKKKGKQQCGSRTLSAAEKLADAYQRKAPDCTWRPPCSPYNLLQEQHAHDPWRVLVICMLLNITTGPQDYILVVCKELDEYKCCFRVSEKVLSHFFDVCPNAEAAIGTDVTRIASMIQSLGLHRKRAAMIQQLSREYLSDDWTHVTQLHGIGKYAADAYAIFCTGKWRQCWSLLVDVVVCWLVGSVLMTVLVDLFWVAVVIYCWLLLVDVVVCWLAGFVLMTVLVDFLDVGVVVQCWLLVVATVVCSMLW
uniref:HhH-GPD domain-containing protein n=1 Tax=Chenopodium quinoa TaxID=63459 RepID=A0A803MNP4_CHEQI